MVERNPEQLDTVFRALGDASRRDMLRRLGDGELSVGELAAPLEMSFAAASKHVRVLERAGLVARRIDGRHHFCSLVPARLRQAYAWLSFYQRFWAHRLDALADALNADEGADDDDDPGQPGQGTPSAQSTRRRRRR